MLDVCGVLTIKFACILSYFFSAYKIFKKGGFFYLSDLTVQPTFRYQIKDKIPNYNKKKYY